MPIRHPFPHAGIQRVRCLNAYESRHRSAELLREPNEEPFRTPDVAKAICIFVLDHFADELSAALAEPGERVVDVLDGEHGALIAEGVQGAFR